ncbi:MAG: hypothetical protein ACTINH_02825 [Lactiplantibacillus plantarum]
MVKYLFARIIRRPSVYFAVFIGSLVTLAQVQEVSMYDDKTQSLYTHWIESFTGSPLPGVFWMLFPLVVAIPCASLISADKRDNYLYLIQIKGRFRSFSKNVFGVNFIVGGLVGIIPLILNFLAIAMILPAKSPNLILDGDGNITINKASLTLFPALFYSNPFLHVLIYLLIGFLVGGLLASVALSIGMWSDRPFVATISSFILIYCTKFLISNTGNIIESLVVPTNYANQVGPIHGISFTLVLSSYTIFMILAWIIYTRGIKRYAEI